MVNYMGSLTSTYPISYRLWLFCILAGAGSIVWGMLFKLLPFPGIERSKRPQLAQVTLSSFELMGKEKPYNWPENGLP